MGTHPIFESDFDCLTEMSLCRIGPVLFRNCRLISTSQNLFYKKKRRQSKDFLAKGESQKVWKGQNFDTKIELQKAIQNDLISKAVKKGNYDEILFTKDPKKGISIQTQKGKNMESNEIR